jgi:hypothetical protein
MQDGRRQYLRTLGGGTALAIASGLAGCSVMGGGGVTRTDLITITDEGFDPKNARASGDKETAFQNDTDSTVTLQAENSEALNHEIDAGNAYPVNLSQGTYVITTKEHSDWKMKLAVGQELEDPL